MRQIGIIVEGMDNSGKSTLAKKLCDYIGQRDYQPGEGPPREGENIDDRCRAYMARDISEWVFDRHPAISQPIYSGIANNTQAVGEEVTAEFYAAVDAGDYIIVYCDPMERGMGGHVARTNEPGREHIDTPEYLADLEVKFNGRLEMYRQWAARRAHFVYRIGDDVNALLASVQARLVSLEPNA